MTTATSVLTETQEQPAVREVDSRSQRKLVLMRSGGRALEAQLEDEALTLARVSASADAQEGIAAMVERRKPVFCGA